VAEAQRRRPQAGHTFDVLLAVVVHHIDASAAYDRQRTGGFMLLEVRVGMEVMRNVAGGIGIAAETAGDVVHTCTCVETRGGHDKRVPRACPTDVYYPSA